MSRPVDQDVCAGCHEPLDELPVTDSESGGRYHSEDCHDDASERFWMGVWSA